MATGTCFSAIKACRIRLVRLDSCGVPVAGPSSVAVSSGFISVTATAEIEEGEEFLVKNACGEPCINEKDCDFLKRYNLTISFCKVDPTVMELTTSNRALLDDTNVIGVAVGSEIQCEDGWSLELWQKTAGADCAGGDALWSYWAFPWLTSGIMGDLTFENGPFSFDISARSKAVGTGTWDATQDGGESLGPFAVLPVGAGLLKGEHLAHITTSVAPPEDTCGTAAFPPPPPPAPVVTSVSPTSGPAAGGTSVTLTGANLTGSTGATVGGVAVTSYVVVNDTTATFVTPAGTLGAKPVVVQSPNGSSNNTVTFTYV